MSNKIKRLFSNEESQITKFRKTWLKKKIDLVDITHLCEFKLGESGVCNSFNEPTENIYHVRVIYRDEIIANFVGHGPEIIDDNKYLIYIDNMDGDFIIFRKVRL